MVYILHESYAVQLQYDDELLFESATNQIGPQMQWIKTSWGRGTVFISIVALIAKYGGRRIEILIFGIYNKAE